MGTDPGALVGPLAVNIGLVVVLVGLSWLSFRRQEL
jgi:hypothetical protein